MIKKYLETYLNLKKGKPASFPLIVFLEITRNCNLRCKSCDIWRTQSEEMSFETIKGVLDQCKESILIHLCGGEVTLRKDLPLIIERAKRNNLEISFTTNGTHLKQPLIRNLKNQGLRSVTVSLDSHIPSVHDELRGKKGTFEKAIRAIKDAKKENLNIIINTVVSKKNIHLIPESVRFFRTLNANAVHLMPILEVYPLNIHHMQERHLFFTNKDRSLLKQEIGRIEKSFKKAKLPKDPFFSDYPDFLAGKRPVCQRGKLAMEIDHKGNVYPCFESEKVAGNINKEKLSDIWLGNRFTQIRKELKDCSRCYSNCHSEPMKRFSIRENIRNLPTIVNELKLYGNLRKI